MRKPLAAVPGGNSISGPTGDSSQMFGGPRRVLPDVLFLQRPTGLDRVQIGRIGWQIQQPDAMLKTRRRDAPIVMGAKIVHHENIAAPQFREQVPRQPRDEAIRIRGGKHRLQHHPAGVAHGADQCQGPTPVHRDPFDVLRTTLHPGMRAVHGDVHARFVQKHEPLDRNPSHNPQERSSSRLDVGPIHFLWPTPFFLTT